MKVGDKVRWQQWDDEPARIGTVVKVDTEYDYLTVQYEAGDEVMACMAPARTFTFLMGSV